MRFVQPIRNNDQLDAMLEYLKNKSDRDYILFLIGINTGLRVSDILSLRVKDVKDTHIKIKEIKTKKYKRMIISPSLRKELDLYIADKKDNEFLIASRQRGKRGEKRSIHRNQAYRIVKEAAKAIGFRDNVGTHTMRKTFGYHYYQKYGDLAQLQKIFNHGKQEETILYIGVEQDIIDTNVMNLYR